MWCAGLLGCWAASFIHTLRLTLSSLLLCSAPPPPRADLFCAICLDALGGEGVDDAPAAAVVQLKCPSAHAFHEVCAQ